MSVFVKDKIIFIKKSIKCKSVYIFLILKNPKKIQKVNFKTRLQSILTHFTSFLDAYVFEDLGKSQLTILAGSLYYVPNRTYEINVTTAYLNVTYYQLVRILIEEPPQLPVSLIE